MNYPPIQTIPKVEYACTECGECLMLPEHFWKDGVKGDKTGDHICPECGYREKI